MITRVSQSIYVYAATLVRVVDGDTIQADIDLGFQMKWRTMVRFNAIDTYETQGPRYHPYGPKAAHFLRNLFGKFAPDGLFYLHTDRDQIVIYNRVAGRPWLQVSASNQDLKASEREFIDVISTLKANGYEKGSEPNTGDPIYVTRRASDIIDLVRN